MKKKIFITMSAIVALFFVVFSSESNAWDRTASTILSGGQWSAGVSSTICPSSNVTAELHVCAPATSATNCGLRESYAIYQHTDGVQETMQTSTCPPSTALSTPVCANKMTWNALAGNNYYVKVTQAAAGANSCGPSTGAISSVAWNCPSN